MITILSIVTAVSVAVTPAPLQLDSTPTPADAIAEFGRQCKLPGAQVWNRSLCGPLLLVDPKSRSVVASEADSAGMLQLQTDGSFVGTLPASVRIANTTVHWGGKDWAMVMLPLPADPFSRLKLLAHESFHREQRALGLANRDPVSPHLDQEEGRFWLRLEIRAWAAALTATREQQRARVHDALAFRAMRYSKFPDADSLESTMELHEGLAEYTGVRVAIDVLKASPALVAKDLLEFENRATFVRSFAYATGPALGVMLDRFNPEWRQSVGDNRSLASVLGRSVGFNPGNVTRSSVIARASRYGYSEVATQESQREKKRVATVARFTKLFVEGPVLILRQQNIGMSFNPGNLVPLGMRGTVYPTGTFTGPWGKIEITESGALLSADFRELRVAAPPSIDGRTINGPGWVLELSDGWKLVPGQRLGDLEASSAAQMPVLR